MAHRLWSIITVVLASVILWHGGGCLALAPGGQVREGLSQVKTYEWGENGLFRVTGEGSQAERFVMAQGQLAMTTGPDGKPMLDVANSHIEYFLQADPSADSAANVMGPAFEASTRQVEILAEQLGVVVELLLARLPQTSGIPPPAGDGDGG